MNGMTTTAVTGPRLNAADVYGILVSLHHCMLPSNADTNSNLHCAATWLVSSTVHDGSFSADDRHIEQWVQMF